MQLARRLNIIQLIKHGSLSVTYPGRFEHFPVEIPGMSGIGMTWRMLRYGCAAATSRQAKLFGINQAMFHGQPDHFHGTIHRQFLFNQCVIVGNRFLANFEHVSHFFHTLTFRQ